MYKNQFSVQLSEIDLHVLGGSGMLSGILADSHQYKSSHSYTRCRIPTPSFINDVCGDFSESDSWETIKNTIHNFQKNRLIVWVHSKHHQKLAKLYRSLETEKIDAIWQVFGTSNSRNTFSVDDFKSICNNRKLNFYSIQLGSIRGRWLTHEEICEGIKSSITNKTNQLIGQ